MTISPRFSSAFSTDGENASLPQQCSSVLVPPSDSSSSKTARCCGARANTLSRCSSDGRSSRKPHDALRLSRRLRMLGTGERGRQRSSQHDAERHDVVVGHPPAELEHAMRSIAGSASGTSMTRFGLPLERTDVAEADADADLLPFRNGTTTREPITTGFARPSSTAYVNV